MGKICQNSIVSVRYVYGRPVYGDWEMQFGTYTPTDGTKLLDYKLAGTVSIFVLVFVTMPNLTIDMVFYMLDCC